MSDRIVTPGRAEIVFYWAVGILFIGVIDWLVLAISFEDGLVARVVGAAFSAGLALFGAWVLIRVSQTRLTIRDSEIVIRNPFRTVVIPRSELRRFAVLPSRKWIVAETSSGQITSIWAISSGVIWTIQKRAAKWNAELGLDA